MPRLLSAALGGALLAGPAAAKEVPWYISPGATGSAVAGAHPAVGYGVELTVGKVPWPVGVAGLAQFEWYSDDSTRRALGLQVAGPYMGLELAWAHRADGARVSDGLQITPFATFVWVYAGARLVFAGGDFGNEYGGVIGLKLPWPTGELPFRFAHGRPLRDATGAVCAVPLAIRPGVWVPIPDLAPAERQAIGRAWLEDGRMEHASVATFRQLADWLAQLGAPEAMVRAARRAADDEVRHAHACFALAERYLGVRIEAPAADVPPDPPPSLARLAVDSLIDGVVGEGIAARLAELTLAETDDLPARAVLRAIAAEEAEHAALARAVIEWARMRSPRTVNPALAAAPRTAFDGVRPCPGRAGRRHGRASKRVQRRAFEEIRARLAA